MICNATLLIVRTLSRYFATRYLGLFAAILAVSTLTIVVIEMLLNLDDMLSADHGPGAPIQYLLLRIPSYYLRELIPVASFAAAFFTLGLSSHWYEVLALKAGGVSPDRLIAPILITASFLGLASFVLGETWIVNSTREWNRHESGGDTQISYREGSFWYHRGLTIYNIAEADPSQRTLRGVRLFNLSPQGRLIRSVVAQRVDVEDDHRWRFHRPTIRHLDPGDPDSGARIERLDEITLDVADPREIALINTDFHGLNVANLRDHITLRDASGANVNRATTVLLSRFVEPIAVVLLALLAAPLGLQVRERRSFGIPALVGIGIVSSFFALRSIGTTLSNEGVVSAAAAFGFLLLLFAAVGALQLRFIAR
ncbi:MAG: LptF/LptG family permease [Deltaproteobacteria bacterium]|nr:LptF/LptG family permease [Deltaproteobacteria bacterium]